MKRKACVHCGRSKVNRPRGMCWTCYYSPARNLYGPVSKYGRRGIGHGYKSFKLPVLPTKAEPGTPEKLAVLAARARAGESLWHPDDPLYGGQEVVAEGRSNDRR